MPGHQSIVRVYSKMTIGPVGVWSLDLVISGSCIYVVVQYKRCRPILLVPMPISCNFATFERPSLVSSSILSSTFNILFLKLFSLICFMFGIFVDLLFFASTDSIVEVVSLDVSEGDTLDLSSSSLIFNFLDKNYRVEKINLVYILYYLRLNRV